MKKIPEILGHIRRKIKNFGTSISGKRRFSEICGTFPPGVRPSMPPQFLFNHPPIPPQSSFTPPADGAAGSMSPTCLARVRVHGCDWRGMIATGGHRRSLMDGKASDRVMNQCRLPAAMLRATWLAPIGRRTYLSLFRIVQLHALPQKPGTPTRMRDAGDFRHLNFVVAVAALGENSWND